MVDFTQQEENLFFTMATAWLNHLDAVRRAAIKKGHDFAEINAESDIRTVNGMIEKMVVVSNARPKNDAEIIRETQPKPAFKIKSTIVDVD